MTAKSLRTDPPSVKITRSSAVEVMVLNTMEHVAAPVLMVATFAAPFISLWPVMVTKPVGGVEVPNVRAVAAGMAAILLT